MSNKYLALELTPLAVAGGTTGDQFAGFWEQFGPTSDPQPANKMTPRVSPDGNRLIIQALFSAEELLPATWEARLAAWMSVPVVAVSIVQITDLAQPAGTVSYTATVAGTLIAYIRDFDAGSMAASAAMTRAYLRANAADWAVADE